MYEEKILYYCRYKNPGTNLNFQFIQAVQIHTCIHVCKLAYLLRVPKINIYESTVFYDT